MNTVMTVKQIDQAVTSDLTDENLKEFNAVCKQQDLRTKSILADEVRAMVDNNTNHPKYASLAYRYGVNEALQAVLKLLEAKE